MREGFRADIEGLRALAVVLVVLNHAVSWPQGGFIGVDVFFVISGYLITGILVRTLYASDRLDFREFYARRMRRIFPMSTLVLVVTVAVSFWLWLPERATSTLQAAGWAFAFLSNWYFLRTGTDYFHAMDAVSPVQQYWSLSIEEQFYLAWPALIALAWVGSIGLVGRTRRRGRRTRTWVHHRVLIALLLVVIFASFLHANVLTSDSPTTAYFATTARVWELACGALLAVLGPGLSHLGRGARAAFGVVGLLTIFAGAVFISGEDYFPGPLALAPVLGTLLVIVSGIGGPTPGLWPLTNPVAGYLGQISYSLYLWHFPAIVFLFSIFPESLTTAGVAISVSVLLSALSYRYVEQPVRRSKWLSRKGDNQDPSG